jgi:hypothetical protein
MENLSNKELLELLRATPQWQARIASEIEALEYVGLEHSFEEETRRDAEEDLLRDLIEAAQWAISDMGGDTTGFPVHIR